MTALLLLLAMLLLGVLVAGWLWIVIIAFRANHKSWSIACLLLPPLYVPYCLSNYRATVLPFWMVSMSGLIIALLSGGVAVIIGSMS